MAELLEIYDLRDRLIDVKERNVFYEEAKKEYYRTGKATQKVKAVRILLMNSKGRLFIQKRSKLKSENPGMYDKSIGGHVKAGDSWYITAIKECAEELGFPASIVSSEEFEQAKKTTDLSIVALAKEIDHISTFNSIRTVANAANFVQPFITKIFLAVFDGHIKFVDGESSGIEVFSLAELNEEIAKKPEKFTADLKFMVKYYGHHIKPTEATN